MPTITPRIARLATTSNPIRIGPASVSTTLHRFGSGWTGRQPKEHVTETQDELNVYSRASKSGKQERAGGSEQNSSTNKKDYGNQNKKAKEENPEAPGPVLEGAFKMKVHGNKVEENIVRGLLCAPKTVADERGALRDGFCISSFLQVS